MACERYKVVDDHDDEVVLDVDLAVLTPELAAEINGFWSGASDRLQHESGEVVRVVVRLFGASAIESLRSGGCWLDADDSDDEKEQVMRRILEDLYEGWPSFEEFGVRIVSAAVNPPPSFFDVTLEAQ